MKQRQNNSSVILFFKYFLISVVLVIGTSVSSCARKNGCPATQEAAYLKVNKKGQLSGKRGKSSLFPKKATKKKKK